MNNDICYQNMYISIPSNSYACMYLCDEEISIDNIKRLLDGYPVSATLTQSVLVNNLKRCFEFICTWHKLMTDRDMVGELGSILGVVDLKEFKLNQEVYNGCENYNKSIEEIALSWFATLVYYRPVEIYSDIIAFLMYCKVIVSSKYGWVVFSRDDCDSLAEAIKEFRESEFTYKPDKIYSILKRNTIANKLLVPVVS